MKIILLSDDLKIVSEWRKLFSKEPDVVVVKSELQEFLKEEKVDVIVSPGNSYGRLDGGYDEAIRNYYSEVAKLNLIPFLQEIIMKEYFGEQPVGVGVHLNFSGDFPDFIHIPTMRVPSKIKDESVIRQCTRTALVLSEQNENEVILLPAFGAGVGEVPAKIVAEQMYLGYKNFEDTSLLKTLIAQKEIQWKDIYKAIETEKRALERGKI